MSILKVNNLSVSFQTRKGLVRAVSDVSFTLEQGKTLALVGESGSGKSVSAMTVLRLLDENARIDSGEVLFQTDEGETDLLRLPKSKLYGVRGNKISVIFQEPMTALNPVFTVERQVAEPFMIHRKESKKRARDHALEMLKSVRIPSAEQVLKQYPHQLSGGTRQRVMIAMALACAPKILIADEPTTALDVSVQAQILRLIKDLQKENKASVLFITHDLGVVSEIADDVVVMYAGEVVERVPAPVLFGKSKTEHPYTEGLKRSIPGEKKSGARLDAIPGNVPNPLHLPKGCKFAPRCKYAKKRCVREHPELFETERGRFVRCFYPNKGDRTLEQDDTQSR